MKKTILITFLIVVALMGAALYVYKHRERLFGKTTVTTSTQPAPHNSSPSTSQVNATNVQPPTTSGYVINVIGGEVEKGLESITMHIINDGDTTLQLDPKAQFKLVGKTTFDEQLPDPNKRNAAFVGALPPNSERSGTITLQAFTDQESELRFYPDPTQPTYIVIPLVNMTAR